MLRRFNNAQIGEVLQQMYKSEVNFDLYSRWDDGFDFKVKNGMENGYATLADSKYLEQLDFTQIEDVISGLAYTVCVEMSGTAFAEWYNSLTNDPDTQKIPEGGTVST